MHKADGPSCPLFLHPSRLHPWAFLQVQGLDGAAADGGRVAEPATDVPVGDGDAAAEEPPVLSQPTPDRSRGSRDDDLEVPRPS